jgi:hypothetical protein
MSGNEDGLQEIVESIGVLADRAESDKWALAEAVATAYAEFPAYTRGLTAGLCSRLRKSTDLIYGLRDAFNLKSSLKVESDLSVSHFATLSHLRDKYNLTDEECKSWLEWSEENGISVRELSMEISEKYCADAKKAYMKRVERVHKEIEKLWQDSEVIGIPNELRALTKNALRTLIEWVTALLAWGG